MGITVCAHLLRCKVISKMFHELVPARSSNILSSGSSQLSGSPPNNKTPLPSADSAMGKSAKA